MKIFDLYVILSRINPSFVTAIIWEEDNPDTVSRIKITHADDKNVIDELCEKMILMYPEDFPSKTQLKTEMNTVHKVNMTRKKNSFGQRYPISL